MRRLAILFAIIAALSTIERLVLSVTLVGSAGGAKHSIRRALVSIADWRAFLIGRLRLAGGGFISRGL